MSVQVRVGRDSKFVVRGTLSFQRWLSRTGRSNIILEAGSTLEINGDFELGQGVTIYLAKGACLTIGGRREESGSGITCDTIVMVKKRMTIGCDFICAWGCVITDCDWHCVEGCLLQSDVVIGDKVWIAHGSSVLKGSVIGSGAIVASRAVVAGQKIPAASLAAGIPVKVMRSDVRWSRDLPGI
jgi:acetyltransferase-like isoleucine patch superfamily enzyme